MSHVDLARQMGPAEHSTTTVTVRPTLIIGLGGTGILAAQWAYHLIREMFGTIPSFVRFLGLDSDVQEEGGPQRLPAADFIKLFNVPGLRLGEVLRDYKRCPHRHTELKWLADMNLNASVADQGCQGISRLGRVLYFQTMHHIERAVSARFDGLNRPDEIRRTFPTDTYELGDTPVVHIAASVCGGTGSGMLLDLAYALQHWGREKFPQPPDIMAHLVLPEAFVINQQRTMDKLRSVAGATLEQIELLMDSRRPHVSVKYPGSTRVFESLRAPFAACYLINGFGPGGGDDRKNLVEMIGRMIRAMTVEPASKIIAADLNNKRHDILGSFDDSTQRALCFGSYGLRFGTAGSTSASPMRETQQVRYWICHSLGQIAKQTPQERRDIEPRIRVRLKDELDFERVLPRLSEEPVSRYAWPSTPVEPGADEDLLYETTEKYVAEEADRLLGEARGRLYTENECGEIVQNVQLAMAGGTAEPGSLSQEYAIKDLGRDLLNKWLLDTHREYDLPAAKRRLVDAMRNEVHERMRKAGVKKISALGRDNVSGIVNEVAKSRFDELRRPVAYLRYREVLKSLRDAFQTRAAALEDVSEKARMAMDRLAADEAFNGDAATGVQSSAYATPLFELKHPDTLEAEQVDVTRQFHAELIAPIAAGFTDQRAEDEGTDQAVDRLVRLVRGATEPIQRFLHKFKETQFVAFHQPIDVREASAHRFYSTVSLVASRASAKIAIDEKGRYSAPLQVVISQHTRNCCVPQLLASLAYDHREAWVSPEYEASTNIWFQLMHFCYGFSLPALDNYEEYCEARRRYVRQARFRPEDLMLDASWARMFRELCTECDREAASLARGDEVFRGDGGAASDLDFSALRDDVLTLFDRVDRGCRDYQGFPSQDVAVDCTRTAMEARFHVEGLLRTMETEDGSPARERAQGLVEQTVAVREGLDSLDSGFADSLRTPFEEFETKWSSALD